MLMRGFRAAVVEGTLEKYVKDFLINWFLKPENIPLWIFDAMEEAQINIK